MIIDSFGRLPRTVILDKIEGANAHNSLTGGIELKPHKNVPGIGAQELYEWKRRFISLLMYLTFIGIPIALWRQLSHTSKRRSELMSHAIEIQAGLMVDCIPNLAKYEKLEAETMTRYAWLMGQSPEWILAEMRKRYPAARRWAESNRAYVERLLKYVP